MYWKAPGRLWRTSFYATSIARSRKPHPGVWWYRFYCPMADCRRMNAVDIFLTADLLARLVADYLLHVIRYWRLTRYFRWAR